MGEDDIESSVQLRPCVFKVLVPVPCWLRLEGLDDEFGGASLGCEALVESAGSATGGGSCGGQVATDDLAGEGIHV